VPRAERTTFPLDLPALRCIESLALDPRVTIFVGETGSGNVDLLVLLVPGYGFGSSGGRIPISAGRPVFPYG
jgi:predicted ATPase